eukprot:TRINITY_DN6966_c0_g2_i1.p1 TRINITY_DN6966_c0_g2~~TRINITY_DN6966_c0_g2_i1.p1  ORF type:complete len:231 (-),score=63.07 TRINITY_DN6966_c0_g2_i1:35-727(-)
MTTKATVTLEAVIEGDYDAVVGNDKTLFLQECSTKLNPVKCLNVRPGSIVVDLSASNSKEAEAAEEGLEDNGLELPSFGNLTVKEVEVKASGDEAPITSEDDNDNTSEDDNATITEYDGLAFKQESPFPLYDARLDELIAMDSARIEVAEAHEESHPTTFREQYTHDNRMKGDANSSKRPLKALRVERQKKPASAGLPPAEQGGEENTSTDVKDEADGADDGADGGADDG